MQDDTKATKVWNGTLLSAICTKNELDDRLKAYNARSRALRLKGELDQLDMMIKSRYYIWSNLGASDELIEYRKEIIEDTFMEERKMTSEARLNKYKGKDTYAFEKKLAADVIEKCGIDTEYEKIKRAKEKLEKANPDLAKLIKVPENKKADNPELATKLDIQGYIKGKLFNFFNGVDEYPETLDDDTETLEEPVETLGV